MTVQKNRGFTLVEMLVVIAIIAVLAAALFPAITGAILTARSTAVKAKGRAVWQAIVTANNDREILSQTPLWPGDVIDVPIALASAADYFVYLMSDGDQALAIAADPSLRNASDMKPDLINAPGVPAGSATVADVNVAWHVFQVYDSDPSDLPIFVTKNVPVTSVVLAATEADIIDRAPANRVIGVGKPFGDSLAVWVTRGGSSFDAKKRDLFPGRITPVLAAAKTSNGGAYPALGGGTAQ